MDDTKLMKIFKSRRAVNNFLNEYENLVYIYSNKPVINTPKKVIYGFDIVSQSHNNNVNKQPVNVSRSVISGLLTVC